MSLGLPEPALLIMVSLASGPKHGYAIILDVDALCGLRMGPGTLYGAIARLERLGLIEPLPADDRRRPYRLTESGARALRDELATLRDVAATGLGRLAAT